MATNLGNSFRVGKGVRDPLWSYKYTPLLEVNQAIVSLVVLDTDSVWCCCQTAELYNLCFVMHFDNCWSLKLKTQIVLRMAKHASTRSNLSWLIVLAVAGFRCSMLATSSLAQLAWTRTRSLKQKWQASLFVSPNRGKLTLSHDTHLLLKWIKQFTAWSFYKTKVLWKTSSQHLAHCTCFDNSLITKKKISLANCKSSKQLFVCSNWFSLFIMLPSIEQIQRQRKIHQSKWFR